MWRLLLLLALLAAQSAKAQNPSTLTLPPGYPLEAALIVDRHNKAQRYAARHFHVQSFIQNFTQQLGQLLPGTAFTFAQWPPVFTNNCPNLPGHPAIAYRAEGPGKHSEGFERGLLMVHKTIWSDFVYRSTQEPNKFTNGTLIIFEDDVFPRVPNFVEATLKETIDMKVGLKFLGWCLGNPFQHEQPPYCTHAYAISLDAALTMAAGVIDCGPSIDVQMINMAKTIPISWDFSTRSSYDFAGDNNNVKSKMAAMGGYFDIGGDILNGDGIFAQRTFPPA